MSKTGKIFRRITAKTKKKASPVHSAHVSLLHEKMVNGFVLTLCACAYIKKKELCRILWDGGDPCLTTPGYCLGDTGSHTKLHLETEHYGLDMTGKK